MQLALFAASLLAAEARTILVTGATGRTGSQVYLALKEQGFEMRALTRDVEKARSRLGCDKCDESEGIFVGDVTKQETLVSAMTGADSLVITTGPAYKCRIPSLYLFCKYYDGVDPKTMSWEAVRTQVSAFAASKGKPLSERHIILMSNTLTTKPDNFLDKVGHGHGCFYSLNGEAFTMSSEVPFTIVKPNGLDDAEPKTKEIIVGHDDEAWDWKDLSVEFISRGDIARVLSYAAAHPNATKGMRFDITSRKGTATDDVSTVFEAARRAWDPRGERAAIDSKMSAEV